MKWRVVMLRKLAVFIISAGLTMSPLSVQALGFGGIKLKSSLNEKLNAEVALISATASDIQSLTIKLATEEAFLRSGIDRTALLNKLKFKVKQRDGDGYYIHVTTSESVREPFMNFLMELNWKNGRMLREYTMLIDPPGRAPKQFAAPAPVVAETKAAEPEIDEAEPEVIAEAAAEPSPFVEPVLEPEPVLAESESELVEPEPAPEEMTAAEPMPAAIGEEPALLEEEPEPELVTDALVEEDADFKPEVFDPESAFADEPTDELWPRIPLTAYSESDESVEVGELGDLDYGITKANDKLWDIAEKLRRGDNSVSVYQVMMALLKNNPDAFIDDNVHRLKVGHVLRINDPSTITAISRKEAANSFIAQTKTWNSYRQQVAPSTVTPPTEVQPIMAGSNAATADVAPTETAGELTLSAPDGQSLTAGGGANEETLNNDLATMQEQLRQAKSDAGTMRTRNVALNDKLQSLEDELNRLQRSISVKDDELAALQQQLSSLSQEPVKAPVKEEPKVTATPEPAAVEPVPAVAPTPVAEEKSETAEKPTAEKAEAAEAPPIPAAEEPAKPAKAPVKVVEEISQQEKVAVEPGIMDTVMGVVGSIIATVTGIVTGLNLGSDSLLFIVAPIAVVVLIIAVILLRRKRQGDNFQESILTGAATAAAGEATDSASADSTTFSEESSFLSDFAMSGASAIEADDSEVDPLTEADVFMAYGRYEAAEERLNEAVQNEPGRMELRAKLLELHHATQNKVAFESAAEDFYASLGGNEADSPLWEKVVAMGTEIAPGNPLFSQGGGSAAIPATAEAPAIDDPGMGMTDSQVMDIGLETGVFEAADLSASQDAATDDMDFNLDLGESAATEEPAAEPDMDFNLDIGGGDTAAEAPAEDLDFNLDMGTTESEPEAAADDAGLDFSLDIGGDAAAEEPASELEFNLDTETTESADSGGLDFDLDIGDAATESTDVSLDFDTASTDDAGSLDLNLDASDTADADLGGGDEVGTKLDLAKAYIDMGDPEGARSILDEVMDEGSSTQKEEAQSLLGQIA